MTDIGRRERKKAESREHISDVATQLFRERGFDGVSITEIAKAADVARPTVFAYFPRKEDLVFDRTDAVGGMIAQVAGTAESPVRAVCDLLSGPRALGGFGATLSEQREFWRLVADSRTLQARAREMASQMEAALADALGNRGVNDPVLCAALIAAAYGRIHLDAIRRVLAGDAQEEVENERAARLVRALDAVAEVVDRMQNPGR